MCIAEQEAKLILTSYPFMHICNPHTHKGKKNSKDIPLTGHGGPVGLQEVKAPTLLRQTANRWWQGCQPYAPATL
jgi:hypothetical protein